MEWELCAAVSNMDMWLGPAAVPSSLWRTTGLGFFPSLASCKRNKKKKKAGTSSLEKQMQPLGAQLSLVNKLQDEIKPNKAAN